MGGGPRTEVGGEAPVMSPAATGHIEGNPREIVKLKALVQYKTEGIAQGKHFTGQTRFNGVKRSVVSEEGCLADLN